jgi:hypothetical protein
MGEYIGFGFGLLLTGNACKTAVIQGKMAYKRKSRTPLEASRFG